jgi:PA domain
VTNKLWISLLLVSAGLQGAANIVILNNDGAGEGFNDPTPAAHVGGNTGNTIGEQRLIAFQHAASLFGATITSSVTIVVRANFNPLACNETGAVLGSAGPVTVHANFAGAPFTSFWYHQALANKHAGIDLTAANPDIGAQFNSNLGQAGCLTGRFFYYGLDKNPGANIDLVTVLLHEFAHGLGFSTVTNSSTGAFLAGLPSIFDRFLLDNSNGLTWNDMTAAQRVASAINTGNLVWNGFNSGVDAALTLGRAEAVVNSAGVPVNVTGTYAGNHAAFGSPLTNAGAATADLMPVVDQGAGAGCTPFNAANALAVNGRIALIDRGTCGFIVKAKNAQNAGAIGVIIANNVAGAAPSLAGGDPSITIPVMSISLADASTLKNALRYRSRTRSGVVTTMRTNGTILTGVDINGRPRTYAPATLQPGSSVSHWDTVLFRNQLMEPAINADLTHSLIPPRDLTFSLLKDIGW